MSKFDEYKDKAKSKADELKDKADSPEGQEKIDKAADFINEKTGGKFEDKIDKVADKAKNIKGDK
ncbi:MAG TPA: antitoxin [Candidatus Stackebrandtia faecavium]|nr:antitoxin [Candidatus Stackebrandtia faecavium]